MSPSAQRAESWSTAIIPARTGIVPACQNDSDHTVGWNGSVRSSCLSRTFWSPLTLPEELRPAGPLTPALPCPTPALSNLRCRLTGTSLWTPTTSAGRSAWWASSTPGPRDLAYHPPVHYLVPGGALSPEGSHVVPRPAVHAWLVPVRALSRLFRGKFKAALDDRWPPHARAVPGLAQGLGDPLPTGGHRHCGPRYSCAPTSTGLPSPTTAWKRSQTGTSRSASRSAAALGGNVLTLPAEAFIRRASSSMLPRGFSQSPLYGLLSPSQSQSAPADQDAPAASLPQQRPWLRRTPHPATVHQTCPVPSSNGAAGHVVGHWLFLVRLSPHARSRHRAREEGAHRPGLASRGTWRSTRRAQPSHRLRDRYTRRTNNPSGLSSSHTPTDQCPAARQQRYSTDPAAPWALHAHRFSTPQPPLNRKSKARRPTNLFNPGLCGGGAPHES